MWDFLNRLATSPGSVYLDVVAATLILGAVILLLHFLISLVRRSQARGARPAWSVWDKLLSLLLIVSTTTLAITAWFAMWTNGVLAGWPLMVHMAGAGMLIVALPVAAVLWAQPSRFFVRGKAECSGSAQATQFVWVARLAFWILLATGFVNVMTMLLSMLPLLDTHALEQMLTLHRYTGLVVVIAVALHIYGGLLGRLGLR